jgi:polyisoprenoid-binding protein YceI
MPLTRLRIALLLHTIAAACLLAAGTTFGQPSVGGAKKKANEVKPKDESGQPEKKPENKEPVVFAVGPDAKSHFEIEASSKRNMIKFESKAPKETIEGKVTVVKGSLDFNPRKMDSIEGTFTVAWKDVDTGNKMRNSHLMSKPWVDATAYPEIVFTVTGIENLTAKVKPVKTIKAELVGKMAMNGQEKETKIPVTLSYLESQSTPKKGESPRDMLGIKAGKFKIALADFDIKGKAGAVGTSVAKEQEFTTASFMLIGPEHKADKKQNQPKVPPKKPQPRGA